MNPGTITGKASISFSHPVYIQSCASVVGPKEGNGPLKSCFDMICEDPMFGEKNGKSLKAHCRKRLPLLRLEKQALRLRIYNLFLPVIFLHRQLPLLLVLLRWEFLFLVCTAHAQPWANLFPLVLLWYLPDTVHTFSVPHPVILQLPKKNFVFL